MKSITFKPGQLNLALLKSCFQHKNELHLASDAQTKIDSGRLYLEKAMTQQTIYGVNTGLGKLASQSIPQAQLETLQKNLVLSHAAGVGEYLPSAVVRLILILKINALAQGYSGVRWQLIETIQKCLSADLLPQIPQQGSVGASGDLAPLAHMACLFIGEGMATLKGKVITAKEGLTQIGLKPLALAAKEGLALVNGTQVSLALLLSALFKSETLFQTALISGALSTTASQSNLSFLDERIQKLSLSQGQVDIAKALRYLLNENKNQKPLRVQDPYSIRCQPQVLGACLEQFRYSAQSLNNMINAVSDNPLVFSDSDAVISGGNFHGQPIAFVADNIANLIATIGNISERRIALLIDDSMSGLPPFLIADSGVNSGFMIAQVTAASLASENKSLAHPASVDTIPTSANQEDHVSMSTFAARRLQNMIQNSNHIVAIELLAACQGVDLLSQKGLSSTLTSHYQTIRKQIAFKTTDHYLAKDILEVCQMLDKEMFIVIENEKRLCAFFE